MIRFLVILLTPFAKASLWLNRWVVRMDELDRIRRALQPGTVVMLRCTCHLPQVSVIHLKEKEQAFGEGPHSGIWTIDRYVPDADDYHLVREVNGEKQSTYATRDTLLVMGSIDEIVKLPEKRA